MEENDVYDTCHAFLGCAIAFIVEEEEIFESLFYGEKRRKFIVVHSQCLGDAKKYDRIGV